MSLFSSFILHPLSLKRRRRAFTLTELMISVAIALLLLLGINQVFKTTSTTVGTSYATLEGARKQLSIDNTLTPDFQKMVSSDEQPALIIHSEAVIQFQDPADANSDTDNNVNTIDLDGDGAYTFAGENLTNTGPADLRSGRSHRLDRISFFARDVNNPFHRQTGDQKANPLDSTSADTLVGAIVNNVAVDETSPEAWIWYGFLRLPSNGSSLNPNGAAATPTPGNYYTPSQATFTAQQNTNNFYARDWALGRQVILLKSQPVGDYLTTDTTGLTNIPRLPPLDPNSQAEAASTSTMVKNPVTNSPWLAAHSRFDIAQTTVKTFRSLVEQAETTAAPNEPNITDWFTFLDYQFNGKPWADPGNPDRASELATSTPFLTRGCSQFIIEFAGDFVTQDNNPASGNYGNVITAKPDGILDFQVDSTLIRRTRWYGFPRDTGGVTSVTNPTGGPDGAFDNKYDVVPVRDIAGTKQPFEHFYTSPSNIETNWVSPGANYFTTANLPFGAQYVCAWGPSELKASSAPPSSPVITNAIPNVTPGGLPAIQVAGPWLIRVVVNVRDPNGRLPNGQTIEHVYDIRK